MEREKEIQKLVNVLRKTARLAQQATWAEGEGQDSTFSVDQYNRVLQRLSELAPSVSAVFQPLAEDAPLSVVAMACRQLAAYFEDEVRTGNAWGHAYGAAFDTDSFKDFWKQSARDIEDLGEFIRENLETWASQHKKTSNGKETAESEEKSDG